MKKKAIVWISGFVFLILILVMFRSFQEHFRSDIARWAKPSLSGENLISTTRLAKTESPLVLVLDNSEDDLSDIQGEFLKTEPGSLLNSEIIKQIKESSGPVVLISADADISAKAWMILSQLGLDNIYILDNENEKFRYEFHPDTSSIISGTNATLSN